MSSALAADHIDYVANDFFGAEKRAIHPAATLLHQSHHVRGRIGESLCIGNVSEFKAAANLSVDFQAHDSIFGKILVSFGASRGLSSGDVLEEGVQGSSLDSIPTED